MRKVPPGIQIMLPVWQSSACRSFGSTSARSNVMGPPPLSGFLFCDAPRADQLLASVANFPARFLLSYPFMALRKRKKLFSRANPDQDVCAYRPAFLDIGR